MSRPIKLSLGIKYENNQSSGKHKFANRLVKCIRDNFADRIEIVDRVATSHAHLTFDGKLRAGVINIYRIDGVWINTADSNLTEKNNTIVGGLKSADAVVYQSEFCKEAVEKYMKLSPQKHTIIYNGADPNEFVRNAKYKPSKPSFITMCKWRPHKRLGNTVEGFLQSKAKEHCCLHVFGEVDKKVEHPNIIYHGWDSKGNKILPWCIASVHISYLDWCPNAVVESLVAGVPVIYANSGGTPYIVGSNGYQIRDHNWNYEPIDLYGDHSIDITELALAYDKAFEESSQRPAFKRSDLNIMAVATKYVKFIEKVIRSS